MWRPGKAKWGDDSTRVAAESARRVRGPRTSEMLPDCRPVDDPSHTLFSADVESWQEGRSLGSSWLVENAMVKAWNDDHRAAARD